MASDLDTLFLARERVRSLFPEARIENGSSLNYDSAAGGGRGVKEPCLSVWTPMQKPLAEPDRGESSVLVCRIFASESGRVTIESTSPLAPRGPIAVEELDRTMPTLARNSSATMMPNPPSALSPALQEAFTAIKTEFPSAVLAAVKPSEVVRLPGTKHLPKSGAPVLGVASPLHEVRPGHRQSQRVGYLSDAEGGAVTLNMEEEPPRSMPPAEVVAAVAEAAEKRGFSMLHESRQQKTQPLPGDPSLAADLAQNSPALSR